MPEQYQNRQQAGRQLAEKLQHLADRDLLVLALPRGGVPVAYEIAKSLHAPLDLMVVRKLGVPGQEELAFGAIASRGIRVLNSAVVRKLGIGEETIEEVADREQAELQRRAQAHRGDEPEPPLEGRYVILTDDGLATGSTMRAGIHALRQHRPESVVVAVPVGPPDSVRQVQDEADEVVCPSTPASFAAVGQWYVEFDQVSDDTIRDLLQRNWEQMSSSERA